MNVLMDVHALGSGVRNPRKRRGIYRYVRDLSRAIMHRGELALFLCASDKWQDVGPCREYLKGDPELGELPFIQNVSRFDGYVARKFRTLDYAIKHASTGLEKLPLKIVMRELARSAVKFRHKTAGNILKAGDLSSMDVYFSPDFLSMPDIVRAVPGVKNFVVVHDIIPVVVPQYVKRGKSSRFARRLERLNKEDWIFTVSQASRDDLCNYAPNIDPERVIVNPIAAGDHFYPAGGKEAGPAVRKKYGIPPDNRYLLSLGAQEERKNLASIFEVFSRLLLEKVEDLSLVVVGHEDPSFLKTLKDRPDYRHIRDHVVFTGFVPDEDLAPVYSSAAVFIFPSHYEGFGLPPLEAMQCGVPVVASNSSSLPEVVGDAGILKDPHDIDGMTDAVLRILRDCRYREALSERSIERARRFSWDEHAAVAVDSFKRALSHD